MNTKELMSGVAVAIDDALETGVGTGIETEGGDPIGQIISWFEGEWGLSFVKRQALPEAESQSNLLRAASFVLLDWNLWGRGGPTLKNKTIEEIRQFLAAARENLVPVFVLTNQDPDEVTEELSKLPDDVYDEQASEKNFVFVEPKSAFWNGTSVDVGKLEAWVYGNPSVYALKTWERVLDGAKHELFHVMCGRSVHWPRVFWNAFREDGADPSSSLTDLINDSLRGRMPVDAFEQARLEGEHGDIGEEELRQLIAETSFRDQAVLPEDEIRSGDLFKGRHGKYWLNVRPDCDCIPRGKDRIEDVEVYCIQGCKLSQAVLRRKFNSDYGNFKENISESVVFGVVDGASLLFNFGKMKVFKYSDVRQDRVGRVLHPYVTRIQQRYALYVQRLALPRIPEAAVGPELSSDAEECSGA